MLVTLKYRAYTYQVFLFFLRKTLTYIGKIPYIVVC